MTITHELKIINIAKKIAMYGFLLVSILVGAIFYLEGFTIEFTIFGALVAALFVTCAITVSTILILICYYTVIEIAQHYLHRG